VNKDLISVRVVESTKSKIIKFIFWGILIGGVFPFITGYVIQKHQSKEARNQLVITQAIPSFQKAYIDCNNIYLSLLTTKATIHQTYTMIKAIVGRKEKNDFPGLLFNLTNNVQILQQKNDKSQVDLRNCQNKFSIYATQLAFLLRLENDPRYSKISDDYSKKYNSVNKNLLIQLKFKLKEARVPFPSTYKKTQQFTNWMFDQMSNIVSSSNLYIKKQDKWNNFNIKISELSLNALVAHYSEFEKLHDKLSKLYLNTFTS
jgi:gas vesicle protein